MAELGSFYLKITPEITFVDRCNGKPIATISIANVVVDNVPEYPFTINSETVLGPQITSTTAHPERDTVLSWRGYKFIRSDKAAS